MRKVVGRPFRKGGSAILNRERWLTSRLVIGLSWPTPELEGVVISKSYGEVRYEVRYDNGRYVRELLPEALSLIVEPTST